MTKVVFLPLSGDPFVGLFAIIMWERWANEVDRLYINYNNHAGIPQEVISEFLSKVKNPKIHVIYHPTGIEHGQALKELLLLSQEDLIMFLEEDAYIFNPGKVTEYFKMIEDGETDIVGSPRGSCGTEIWDVSKIKYNLNYEGIGDKGPNWWPNFFFCKRTDLLKTDLNFGSKQFNVGDYCKELDYTFKTVNCGDTFVWASMQLRAMGLRSIEIPQHHASPNEITDKEGQIGNWYSSQKPFDRLHVGSLSAGLGGYLSGVKPNIASEGNKLEMETRCAFWNIALMNTEGFNSFKIEYSKGIGNLVEKAGLDYIRILKKMDIYKELLNLK